jgi:signal transduction histidine kinase
MSVRRTIRFRITAVATVAVAVVLIVAGLGLVLFQRSALTSSVDQNLTQRADDLSALLQEGSSLPDSFVPTAREGFTQLVGPDGVVMVSSPNLAGAPPLPLDAPAGSGDSIQTVSALAVDDDLFRVLSRRFPNLGVLHVGATLDVVSEAAAALATALVVIIPIVVAALGTLVWWLVGRTLQPVEAMRSEVAAISSTDLHHRVPRPDTGDEIDRLAGTMNDMLNRLERSVARQQRFVADASHELRSPLTRLRSQLEVELTQTGDPSWTAPLRSLLDDVVGMQEVVEDLLYLARADEGRVALVSQPVDLDDLVVEQARRIQTEGRVEVDLTAVSGAHVVGNPGQLCRAVRNLLDNAARHATARVILSLAESTGTAVLTIADDGPGIAPEDRERVFERFSRLDEARTADAGGGGLGLAIARDIVVRHGGTLEVLTTIRPGATFELRLPTAQ